MTGTVNVVDVTYAQTGASVNTDTLGMGRCSGGCSPSGDAQHFIDQGPTGVRQVAALMFVGLDKLYNQAPQEGDRRGTGALDRGVVLSTDLTAHGFFRDREVPRSATCVYRPHGGQGHCVHRPLGSSGSGFCMHPCAHCGSRLNAWHRRFNAVLVIDEFHHVSRYRGASRLGALLKEVMTGRRNIVAMTGSYRGDSVPVLSAEDEARFTLVTFNYFMTNSTGYQHLKSLGIGHHFLP